MTVRSTRARSTFFALGALTLATAFVCAPRASAQASISTGTIQGSVTDASGAVVPGASVVVSNKATGQALHLTANSSGSWSSGALQPGDYVVSVSAQGFRNTETLVTVQVGVTSSAPVKLEVGQATSTVTVEASGVQVNTVQATVQDVVTRQEIESLPISGRNFLDLATLSPGVQIQDGMTFDPTKHGYSSVSFAGRFGRTARIEVDGIDISDETVGTTTQNLPMSGLQEFQVEQSSLDPSTELTSSGAVNVTTRAGTNQFHGQAFGIGQSHKAAARYGDVDVPWHRDQWGASIGGPVLHDKLFFFADVEKTAQPLTQSVLLPAPFNSLSGAYGSPFVETMALGRLDWNISSSVHAFFRYSFDQNSDLAGSASSYSPYLNVDHTPVYAAGLDMTTGSWTHSVRFAFTRFRNGIVDGSQGVFNPAPGAELSVGSFASGPDLLAPQETAQDNTQIKYDGTKISGVHTFTYGFSFNHILGGGYAKFFGLAPQIISGTSAADLAFANQSLYGPGGQSNPLNYPVDTVILGNGQGYFTNIADLGFPAGGQFDNRVEAYFGDSWKVKPNFSLNLALRYVRDTGRSDAQLPAVPALDQWEQGLGRRINQPDLNFAPQIGIAWDPWKNGKTVFRAGGGLFYENAIFNNVLFDAPGRLQNGLFYGLGFPCPAGSLQLPTGSTIDTSGDCNQPIGAVYQNLIGVQQQFQAATAQAGAAVNGSYVGNTLAEGGDSTGNNLLGPNYRTPYSLEFNGGIQHQFGRGTVLSVDYLRNVGLHQLLAYDINHTGDARYLNQAAAVNAISATNQSFGCPTGSAGIDCAIAAGASMQDYAGNGLDSGRSYLAGFPAAAFGLTPGTGAAFPGMNPNVGENIMLFPIGKSTYNALQVALRQNISNPLPGVKQMNLEVSYALSRTDSFSQDQDFINIATDQNNINHFYGPNALDRTHQFSFGGVMELPHGFQTSFTTHIDSALPLTLTLPASGAPGEIYRTDVTGDGTTGDVLPGTNVGSFGRSVKVGDLNSVINSYNTNDAGKLTPAGNALVNAGLFTPSQLTQLGANTPSIQAAPAGEVGLSPFIDTDLSLAYEWRIKERVTIEPKVTLYNLFNVANYDASGNTLGGTLNGLAGFANGTTVGTRTNRTLFGSGVYAFGAPRALEWGAKITF